MPTSMTVKQTVAGLMKNVVKPTSKTKHKTWLELAGAGHWEEIPTTEFLTFELFFNHGYDGEKFGFFLVF